MAKILVVAEVNDDVLHDGALACVGGARTLAGDGGDVRAVLIGARVAGHADALFSAGADAVTVIEDESLAAYTAGAYRAALAETVGAASPDLILMAASTLGNDLAAALAASLKAACVLDCDTIEPYDGGFTFGRAGFDRKVMSHFVPAAAGPAVAAVRDGAFPPAELDASRTGTAERAAVSLSQEALAAKVIRRDVAKKTVNLKDAKVIVAAGAGVGSAEGLALVKELADALGAEVGATRAVVDAGWLAADHQIGQTGATVRPDVYIACGISGAVQHRVGMLDAGKIVAVNIDPQAPIFRIAHIKLVGDLKTVVPKLTQLIRG